MSANSIRSESTMPISRTVLMTMTTLAVSPLTLGAGSAAANGDRVKLDGPQARAISVAYEAYRQKAPNAELENYTVVVQPDDGKIKVSFVPKPVEGAPPTLGGRNANGAEISVWVSKDDYSVEKVSGAR